MFEGYDIGIETNICDFCYKEKDYYNIWDKMILEKFPFRRSEKQSNIIEYYIKIQKSFEVSCFTIYREGNDLHLCKEHITKLAEEFNNVQT